MKTVEIKHRFTNAVLFSAEVQDDDAHPVRSALKLAVAAGADLSGADLSGANHIADRVIDGGLRSDGYRFLLTRTEDGEWRIKAGCRNLTVSEATSHWDASRPVGNPLGDETRLIIAHMLAIAALRKWPAELKTEKAA